MSAFFWTVIVVLALDITGKCYTLAVQDEKRNLKVVPLDLVLMCGLLAWAIYLKP